MNNLAKKEADVVECEEEGIIPVSMSVMELGPFIVMIIDYIEFNSKTSSQRQIIFLTLNT